MALSASSSTSLLVEIVSPGSDCPPSLSSGAGGEESAFSPLRRSGRERGGSADSGEARMLS